jgi:putative endonuclease
MDRRATGTAGERLAEWFLARRGYRTLERNARVGRFEVDLVMEKGEVVVLVEVKTRGASSWGGAIGALGGAQRGRLAQAAEAIGARFAGRSIRLDVVTVEETTERLVVEHLMDAFGASGSLR